MIKKIRFEIAAKLGFSILLVISLVHLSFILGILLFDFVPKEFLWGGKMKTANDLLQFEIISLMSGLFGLLIIWIRKSEIASPIVKSTTRIFLWVYFILFTLNTIGNLLADSNFERILSIVTVALSILFYRMAIEPIKINSHTSTETLKNYES